jgi:prepilin-type N-terminal cleavage/methylation domain-containing protein
VQIRQPGYTPRVPGAGGRRTLRAGFTLVELLVVVGIVVVLVGILVPVVGRARASGQSMTCLSNLRQVGRAFQLYANANNGYYPDPAATQESWESMLADHIGSRQLYRCPSDGGLFDKLRSSYDWRDTGNIKTTVAGRSVSDVRRTAAVIVFDALPDWHRAGHVNVLRFDHSAEDITHQDCLRDLDTPIATP